MGLRGTLTPGLVMDASRPLSTRARRCLWLGMPPASPPGDGMTQGLEGSLEALCPKGSSGGTLAGEMYCSQQPEAQGPKSTHFKSVGV